MTNIEDLPYDIFRSFIFPYIGEIQTISKTSRMFFKYYLRYRIALININYVSIDRYIDQFLEYKTKYDVDLTERVESLGWCEHCRSMVKETINCDICNMYICGDKEYEYCYNVCDECRGEVCLECYCTQTNKCIECAYDGCALCSRNVDLIDSIKCKKCKKNVCASCIVNDDRICRQCFIYSDENLNVYEINSTTRIVTDFGKIVGSKYFKTGKHQFELKEVSTSYGVVLRRNNRLKWHRLGKNYSRNRYLICCGARFDHRDNNHLIEEKDHDLLKHVANQYLKGRVCATNKYMMIPQIKDYSI